MRLKYKSFLLIFSLSLAGILQAQYKLSDSKATKETVALYKNLAKALKKGYFIGHQDDLAYGVNWKYQEGRSDVKEVVNDYPGLYGWELGDLELGKDKNLDGVPFDKMKEYIKEGYKKGAVITISWHCNNPITGKNAWDNSQETIASILPNGDQFSLFQGYLDKVAAFLLDLKGSRGEQIPVLWRPFHEHTGTWFWWGAKSTSDSQYLELYKFSLDYLRNKGLHNLISVYNTGGEFSNPEEFLKRYPGDHYVDIVSFDIYQRGGVEESKKFATQLDSYLSILDKVATTHHKIPEIGEIGCGGIPDHQWFTQTLLPVFNKHQFSSVLFWRNAGLKSSGETEFYVPYKSHPAAPDFVKFYNDKKTLFGKDATKMKMYK